MAIPDYAAIGRAITGPNPCGPDLDLDGDPDFMQFMARVEYTLPANFFTRDDEGRSVPFDRGTFDFKAEFATLAALLETTRDLRLLSICCRLHALDRDLANCADCLSAIATLLSAQWDAVHPRGEDGDFSYRIAVLQTLDDAPTMILPLQHLPLFTSRRYGPIALRMANVASGAAQARPGETVLDTADLDRLLSEADPEGVKAAIASARRLREAALAIAETSSREVGGRNAVKLDRLVAVADGILNFLGGTDAVAPASDSTSDAGSEPDAAPVAQPGPGTTAPSIVATLPDAAAALAAVIGYFETFEPSSPAALLARQAQRLIGLPFHAVIRALLPDHADDATVSIGPTPEKSFQIRVDRMTEGAGEDDDPQTERSDPSDAGPASPPAYAVASRPAAIALLRQVGGFYRAREPASPIPLFTDRACVIADKDFLTILSDVLPGVRLSREQD